MGSMIGRDYCSRESNTHCDHPIQTCCDSRHVRGSEGYSQKGLVSTYEHARTLFLLPKNWDCKYIYQAGKVHTKKACIQRQLRWRRINQTFQNTHLKHQTMLSQSPFSIYLGRLSSLNRRAQSRIRNRHSFKLIRIPRDQQITYNPRKHHTTPYIKMRAVVRRQVVLISRRLTECVHVSRTSLVQIDMMPGLFLSNTIGDARFVGEVLNDFAAAESSAR
jgi:hypothetical protein